MAKKILHIAQAAGGVERYLVTLLNKLKKYPEYDHILVCSNLFDIEKFKGLASEIVVIDSMQNAISAKDIRAILAVRRAVKKYKPDIVYCHSSKAGAIGRAADLFIKNKLIYNPHGWAFNMKNAGKKKLKFYAAVEKLLSPLTDEIVCISEYEKESAIEHRICKTDKLTVINNGINFDEFDGLSPKKRETLSIPQDAFVVGTIGRLSAQKAPDVFVKMASEIKKSISEAFFLMVGDDIAGGEFRGAVSEMISQAGLSESFLITGWVNDPLDYLGIFDEAVLLSRWEGFGLVLPEYMYLGKPIVATKADAIPYVVGNAGLLVDIDDYKQAAEAVIKLYKDKELRNDIAEKEKKRVELFDAQRTADEHLALFNSLVK